MTRNVGRWEWKLGVGLAIVFPSIAFFIELPQLWEGACGVVSVALLLSGRARYCPVNHFLGIRSRELR